MTTLTQLNLDADPIEYWMPLRSAKKVNIETSVLPASVARMFDLDPDLAAVSVEYLAQEGGRILDVTIPVSFWRYDDKGAYSEGLTHLCNPLLQEISSALISPSASGQHSLIPSRLYACAQEITGSADRKHLLGIYMRDVSFFMPSDLGGGLEDIEGQTFSSRRQLAEIMSGLVGQAWHVPCSSNHELLAQRKRLKQQAKIFDGIFLEQTGVGIATHLGDTMQY